MKLSRESLQALHSLYVPDHMHGGIIRYYESRIPPGDFLLAVINNDLKLACMYGDDVNKNCLPAFVAWFYNYAPSGSWGYEGAADKWLYCESVTP